MEGIESFQTAFVFIVNEIMSCVTMGWSITAIRHCLTVKLYEKGEKKNLAVTSDSVCFMFVEKRHKVKCTISNSNATC